MARGSIGDGHARQHFGLGNVRRKQGGKRKEPLPKHLHGIVGQQGASAGGDHDGIDHNMGYRITGKGAGYSLDGSGIVYHAHLDGRRTYVGHHSVYLLLDHRGRHTLHTTHSKRILYGDGRDGRCGVHAQGREGLDVCLNASPATAIRTGNGECGDVVPGTAIRLCVNLFIHLYSCLSGG